MEAAVNPPCPRHDQPLELMSLPLLVRYVACNCAGEVEAAEELPRHRIRALSRTCPPARSRLDPVGMLVSGGPDRQGAGVDDGAAGVDIRHIRKNQRARHRLWLARRSR